MERELFILRHAKSDWHSEVSRDFDRPLNARGERDAPRMGRWMGQQDLCPGHVISSPARRAQQTALAVCGALGIPEHNIRWEDRLYLAELRTLLDILTAQGPEVQSLMLVGHNPGLESLLVYLAGDSLEEPEDGKLLPTATLARLSLPGSWQQLTAGCARCDRLMRPRALP